MLGSFISAQRQPPNSQPIYKQTLGTFQWFPAHSCFYLSCSSRWDKTVLLLRGRGSISYIRLNWLAKSWLRDTAVDLILSVRRGRFIPVHKALLSLRHKTANHGVEKRRDVRSFQSVVELEQYVAIFLNTCNQMVFQLVLASPSLTLPLLWYKAECLHVVTASLTLKLSPSSNLFELPVAMKFFATVVVASLCTLASAAVGGKCVGGTPRPCLCLNRSICSDIGMTPQSP